MIGEKMKLKIGLAVIALGLLISGCNKQASFGKLDKTWIKRRMLQKSVEKVCLWVLR